jgi:hypothetical protein
MHIQHYLSLSFLPGEDGRREYIVNNPSLCNLNNLEVRLIPSCRDRPEDDVTKARSLVQV